MVPLCPTLWSARSCVASFFQFSSSLLTVKKPVALIFAITHGSVDAVGPTFKVYTSEKKTVQKSEAICGSG